MPIDRGPLSFVEILLRDRDAALAHIQAGEHAAAFARAMLVTIIVSCSAFGVAIGWYRGGIQILYAGVKLPLLMLLTAVVCTPVLSALNAALDRPSDLRRDIALILASLALGSLVLLAQAPVVLLAVAINISYHQLILLLVGCCAIAGAAGLSLLYRGVGAVAKERALTAATALVVVVAIVGAQMAWTLRPYAVRPRTDNVPFVRNVEGNLIESVARAFRSARGKYADEERESR